MTPLARFIVCEKTGVWAIGLRRLLGNSTRVYETRTLPACWRELQVSPASLLAVEWSSVDNQRLLQHLGRLPVDYPLARVVVLASRADRPLQWLWREAGAVHAIFSVRELGQIVRLAQRHLAAAPEAQAESLSEQLQARLPWGANENPTDPRQEPTNGLRPN